MGCPAGSVPAQTAPAWHFGTHTGLQVWVADGDRRVLASLLIDPREHGGPVVLLHRSAVGLEAEGRALAWALAQVAEDVPGFYVLRAD